jgi:DNA polymerase (family 10)
MKDASMDRKQVAEILDEIGSLLELKGENKFKCNAYHNASRVISGLQQDLKSIVEAGELSRIKGIGDALDKKITELVLTGKSAYYEELKQSFPDGLLEILQLPGVGPKKVKVLHEKLNISSINELEYACVENRLTELEGFGEKSQEEVLKAIEHFKKTADMFLYGFARERAEELIARLQEMKVVLNCSIAGSLRRRYEIVRNINIVARVQKTYRDKVAKAFTSFKEVDKIASKTDVGVRVMLGSGIQAELVLVEDMSYPFCLHYYTGSKKYLQQLARLVQGRNVKLTEHGLYRGGKLVSCNSENDIFESLGLAFIPPELREGENEIELAAKHKIPELVKEQDIRGTFHCHTDYSDGVNTVEDMAREAQKLGFEYLGIADHSKSASYANGLSEDGIERQQGEIDGLNKKVKNIRILKGIECDVLADGSLDYEDKILATFDYVVASIHSKFKMSEEEATKRIVRAISNKYVTMLGHPTGRLLLGRAGYPVNMKRVIDVASQNGVIIELNANPYRLDLDWRWMYYAKEKGVKIAIDPDAHRASDMKDVFYGVGTARKGWLTKTDILNTNGVREIVSFLERRRQR